MDYRPVIVFGRFVPLFWKQLLAYTPFCIDESFICCSLGYFRLQNAKKLDGHVGAHSILVNAVKTTFSLWKSAFFSQKCQKSLFCPFVWPQTQIFWVNDEWKWYWDKTEMGRKFFSESASPSQGPQQFRAKYLVAWLISCCSVFCRI